jgi:glycosyltransferase involved in cell wall biosynthesis
MKVLLINPTFYAYGGAERLIVKLANYLTDKGVETTLITQEITPEIKEEFKETRIIITETMENMAPTVQGIIHQFDVVNPHNDPTQLLLYPRMRPSVWMCNEPPYPVLMGQELPEPQRNMVRNHITLSVVADDYNRKRFMDIYDVEPRVNHYGVDYDFFKDGDPMAAREKYGLGESFVMLQVGMMTFTKNQLKTVSVFKKLKRKIPDAKLVLVGYNSGPYFLDVKRCITESGLRKDIIVTGEIPQEEVKDLYYAADALLAPIMAQGGWLSTFEAMATGLPIIVSPKMTAASIIMENELGAVTEDYVDELLALYNKRQRVLGPKKWVKENLSWDKFCGTMLGYFEEVAN